MDPHVVWCQMTMQIQTLVDTNEPATFVQSISRSVRQKVYFLGRPVGDFGVSDDDQMILVVDPWCWRRSTDIMPQKSDFKKITGAKHRETWKRTEKWHFWRKSGDPNFQGRRRPCTHGRRRPWGFCPFSNRCSVVVFRAFLLLFSPVFFLTFLLIYWLNSSKENLSKGSANQSTKFPIFGKAEDFVADFPQRVETWSNDVGMTWNLRWSFLSIR